MIENVKTPGPFIFDIESSFQEILMRVIAVLAEKQHGIDIRGTAFVKREKETERRGAGKNVVRVVFDGLKKRRRRAVGEDRTRNAVPLVDMLAVCFRRNEKNLLRDPRFYQTFADAEPVDVAAASEIDIKRAAFPTQSEPRLHNARGGRKKIVGRLRAKDEEIDFVGTRDSRVEESLRGEDAKVGRRLVLRRDRTLVDTEFPSKLLLSPFREGFDEFGVVQSSVWQPSGDSRNLRNFHSNLQRR